MKQQLLKATMRLQENETTTSARKKKSEESNLFHTISLIDVDSVFHIIQAKFPTTNKI